MAKSQMKKTPLVEDLLRNFGTKTKWNLDLKKRLYSREPSQSN